VSTQEQASEGVSLAAQKAKLEAYALAMDLQLVAVISDEGISAKNLRRPGLRQVLQMLDDGEADGVIVTKLDRMTRSVRDLAELIDGYFGERAGKSLLSVTDSIDTRSAAGRLVLNVLVSVCQWEREAVGERTREAMEHLKREGVQVGRAGIGWRYSEEVDAEGRKRKERVADEWPVIERIGRLRAQGLSHRAIADTLAAEGWQTQRGGRWHGKVVRSVLLRSAAC
jgi:DNA invertase Pin-like site-specific DNA recombinase